MLPKEKRLSSADVDLVFVSKRKIHNNDFFRIIISKRDDFLENRYAVVVSKKNARLATDRNRIRRCIYGCLSQQNQDNKNNYAVLLYPTKKAIKTSAEELCLQVSRALDEVFSLV